MVSLSFDTNLGKVFYGKNYLTKFLEIKLQMVPGFDHLVDVDNEEGGIKNSFFFSKDKNNQGFILKIHVALMSRAQMIAIALDIKELLIYVFKEDLNIKLANVDVFIEST